MADVAALLAEVKGALQQATPGPWIDRHTGAVAAVKDGHGRAIPATFDDARLIAKSPEWLGALVQAVEDQLRRVDAAEQERDQIKANAERAWRDIPKTAELAVKCEKLEAEVAQLRADGQRLTGTLDKIAAVMRDRTATEDEALSEIQDFLTIAGYDVPLRSVKPSRGSDQ